jgi:hypothetical protein
VVCAIVSLLAFVGPERACEVRAWALHCEFGLLRAWPARARARSGPMFLLTSRKVGQKNLGSSFNPRVGLFFSKWASTYVDFKIRFL